MAGDKEDQDTLSFYRMIGPIGHNSSAHSSKAGMCVIAVSYTHLDVYKRQVLFYCVIGKN